MCVDMCACAHMEIRGRCRVSWSITLHLIPIESGSLTKSGARLVASKLLMSSHLHFPQYCGYKSSHGHSWLFM